MGEQELMDLTRRKDVAPWRIALARRVESRRVQSFIVALIILNAAILGMETSPAAMARWGGLLVALDRICLAVFVVEIALKMTAYQRWFWRSGWNIFDVLVVAMALVPGAGAWSVLRSLRVLRVLRLLTVIPSLRKVVAAFLHSIPGLAGVVTVMAIFLYTAAVLATNLFGADYPEWFGGLGRSLFSLFQILTLEGWADMARTIMEKHPWAPAFFIPFILIATFTVLNLFIGIIVSTMQELSMLPDKSHPEPELAALLERMEADIKLLRASIDRLRDKSPPGG